MSPVCILTLNGELTLWDGVNLRNKLSDRLSTGIDRYILDLAEISHIERKVFSLLLERQNRMKQYGGGIAISGASKYIKDLFALAGMSKSFQFFKSEKSALESFRSR